jgi:hypothetical protein
MVKIGAGMKKKTASRHKENNRLLLLLFGAMNDE